MWMNLDQVPAGKHMFTVAVTESPVDTPADEIGYDEVDVIAPSRSTAREVVALADLEGYEHCRVIGVSDQSDGYVMWQDPKGDLR